MIITNFKTHSFYLTSQYRVFSSTSILFVNSKLEEFKKICKILDEMEDPEYLARKYKDNPEGLKEYCDLKREELDECSTNCPGYEEFVEQCKEGISEIEKSGNDLMQDVESEEEFQEEEEPQHKEPKEGPQNEDLNEEEYEEIKRNAWIEATKRFGYTLSEELDMGSEYLEEMDWETDEMDWEPEEPEKSEEPKKLEKEYQEKEVEAEQDLNLNDKKKENIITLSSDSDSEESLEEKQENSNYEDSDVDSVEIHKRIKAKGKLAEGRESTIDPSSEPEENTSKRRRLISEEQNEDQEHQTTASDQDINDTIAFILDKEQTEMPSIFDADGGE